jgi:hypothetical protein
VTYGNRSQDGRGFCLVVTTNFCRGHDTNEYKSVGGLEGVGNKRQGNRNERMKEGREVLIYMYVKWVGLDEI